MARGYAPVFGGLDARFSLLFVRDLADAVVRWILAEETPTGIFEPDDGREGGYDWPAIAGVVADLTGRPVRPVKLPVGLLSLPAALNYAAGRVTGFAPMLTPGKLRELRHDDWVCQRDGLNAAIGWQPGHDLRAGLLETPGWRR